MTDHRSIGDLHPQAHNVSLSEIMTKTRYEVEKKKEKTKSVVPHNIHQ